MYKFWGISIDAYLLKFKQKQTYPNKCTEQHLCNLDRETLCEISFYAATKSKTPSTCLFPFLGIIFWAGGRWWSWLALVVSHSSQPVKLDTPEVC